MDTCLFLYKSGKNRASFKVPSSIPLLRLMNDGKVEMNRTSKISRKAFEFRTEMKTSTWSAVEKGETRNYGRLEWISEQLTGLRISMEETLNKSMEYTPYTYGRMVGAHTDVVR